MARRIKKEKMKTCQTGKPQSKAKTTKNTINAYRVFLSLRFFVVASFMDSHYSCFFSHLTFTHLFFFIIGYCVCCRFLVLCVLYSCGRIYVNIKKNNKV